MPDVFDAKTVVTPVAAEPSSFEKKVEAQQLIANVMERVGERKRSSHMRAYVVTPNGKFADEQQDEAVAMVLRAHPITNVGWIIGTILLLLVPTGIDLVGMSALVPGGYVFVGKLVWYMILMGYVLERFLYWYYSVLIITNERIVDIDFTGLLHRDVSYAALNHIEEPSLLSGGLWQSLFNFGDVKVSTAAEVSGVEIHNVPHPDLVLKVIAELSEELEKRRERGE